MGTTLSDGRRRELADFLRDRRDRLQPADVGLPAGRRRRASGLRREEVAALAGISTEWYKRLEQGRDVRASADALASIGDALRLEPGERHHLLRLAGYAVDAPVDGDREGSVGGHIQLLIDQLEGCPCWVTGERWDYLAWNDAARVISGDLSSSTGIRCNALYQLFLEPRIRDTLVDWAHHARGLVGLLRNDYARWIEDPWYNELIRTLEAESPEFAEWWHSRDITAYQDGVKHYDHPELGRLSFTYTSLRLSDERYAQLSLIAYIPVDGTDTRDKLLGLSQV